MKKRNRGRFFVAFLMLAVLLLFGCGKEPGVDPSVRPEAIFSHYEKLTSLYGTVGRMETLNALDIDLQQVNIENPDRLGLPMKENYAGVEFDVFILFSGKDSHFSGVEYQAEYRYPEEKEKLIADVLTLSKQLIADFGPSTDTSFVFNWVETNLKEEWNRDIAYWQDPSLLQRLLDEEFAGELLWWNLTPVASETVLKELESYEDESPAHGLLLDLNGWVIDGTVSISIYY